MRKVRCYECGKSYDFDTDDFCPKCGAFNQPGKRASIGADGAVIRAEGLNEKNHAGSFIHQEFHAENRVRKAVGLSKGVKRTAAPQSLPRRQEASGPRRKQQNFVQSILWIVAAIIIVNVLSSVIGILLW
mgnify:CR=1 FL=1